MRQERHAKTLEIAQKEVLICIGICLHERFQRIQQRLKQGQQACDLLFYVALQSLKHSFEMAFESKQGISGTVTQIYTVFTVWKFHEFSVTQILREINIGESRQTAVFTI